MRKDEVFDLLGPELHYVKAPFQETWFYKDEKTGENYRIFEQDSKIIFNEKGLSSTLLGSPSGPADSGQTRETIRKILGEPTQIIPARAVILWYSEPEENGRYRARGLALDNEGIVVEIISYDTWD